MEAVIAMTLIMGIYAFGELVAQKTKAILSTTLVIAVTMLMGFWVGMPADILDTASISGVAMILVSFLITSLGTTMNFKQLKEQWKTVVISMFGVIVGVTLIIIIGRPLIGRDMAIAGSPIFAGANAAALILKDELASKGLNHLFNFALMVLVFQNFIGIPIASFALRREAQSFIKNSKNIEKYSMNTKDNSEKTTKKLISFPESLDTPMIRFIKLGIVASLGHFVSTLTNGAIHPFVAGLLLGVVFTELGFLENNILQKTNSATFILFTTTVVIFSNLADVTPGEVAKMIIPTLITLGIGVIGVIIAGLISSKILKIGPYLAITLGLTCTFGFPTTMFISQEVSDAIGRDEEEKQALLNYLLPPMLTAGFVTVTMASVIVTGFVVKLL